MLINGVAWLLRKVSNERWAPPNYDASEPWVIPPGSVVPTWMCVPLSPCTLRAVLTERCCRRFIAGRVGMGEEEQMHEHVEMRVEPLRHSHDASSLEHIKHSEEQHTMPVSDEKDD